MQRFLLLLSLVVVAASASPTVAAKTKTQQPLTMITDSGKIPTTWRYKGVEHRISLPALRKHFTVSVISKRQCTLPPRIIAERLPNTVYFRGSRCTGKSCDTIAKTFLAKAKLRKVVSIAKKDDPQRSYDTKLRGVLK